MSRALQVALALVLGTGAGCSSSETKPTSTNATETPPPASTKDVTLSIKNEAAEPRLVWVETYHPEKGKMSGAPDNLVQLGTLASGESITKTFPVAIGGWYRVIGANSDGDQGDKRVKFMGSFAKVKDADEPPVRINK